MSVNILNLEVKSFVSWDETLCSPLKFNHHFRRTYHLHLQGWRMSQVTTSMKLSSSLSWLILQPWRWRRYVPVKHRFATRCCIFITTAVRTSNATTFKVSAKKKHAVCKFPVPYGPSYKIVEIWFYFYEKLEFMFHRCKTIIRFHS
jgi:hypothetical protein